MSAPKKWKATRKKRVDWTEGERQKVVEAGARMLYAGVKPHERYIVKTLFGPAQEAALSKDRHKGKTAFSHQPTAKKLLAAMRSAEQRIRSQAGQLVMARPPEPPAPAPAPAPEQVAPTPPTPPVLLPPSGSVAVLLGQQLGVLLSTAFATVIAQPELRQVLATLLSREPAASPPQEVPRPDPTPEPPRVPEREPQPAPAEPAINGSVRHNPHPRPEPKHHKPKPKVLIAGLPADRYDKVARALNDVCKPVFWSDKISGGSGDTSNAAVGRLAGSCPVTFALTEIMSHGSMWEAKKHSPDFRSHAGGDSTLIQNIRDWVEKEYNARTWTPNLAPDPQPQPIAGLLPCL